LSDEKGKIEDRGLSGERRRLSLFVASELWRWEKDGRREMLKHKRQERKGQDEGQGKARKAWKEGQVYGYLEVNTTTTACKSPTNKAAVRYGGPDVRSAPRMSYIPNEHFVLWPTRSTACSNLSLTDQPCRQLESKLDKQTWGTTEH
jgi:hypothetical protein